MYGFIFYYIYRWTSKGEKQIPVFNACIVFSFLQFFNLISLLIVADILFEIGVFEFKDLKIEAFFLSTSVFILNCLYLFVNNRYKKYIAKNNSLPEDRQRKYSWLVFSYVLFSIVLFFILATMRI